MTNQESQNSETKKILIFGYGLTGKSALNYFSTENSNNIITVFDSKSIETFDDRELIKFRDNKNIKFIFGQDVLENYDFDFAIISPGVKPYHPIIKELKEREIQIYNDVSYFIEKWRDVGPIVGVTGSNGKSTIVSLLHHVLKGLNKNSILVGNIGKSPLDYLSKKNKPGTIAVIELSSYQLELFQENHYVDIAVLSNITSNHLDRYHGSISEYTNTKLKIGNSKYTKFVIDIDSQGIQKYALPNIKNYALEVFPVSLETNYTESVDVGIYTDENGNLIFNQDLIFKIGNSNLLGLHNIYNIALVLGVLNYLSIEINEAVSELINNFSGLKHRIEKVDIIKEVLYVNDSKSTSPDATRVAIEAFSNLSKNPNSNSNNNSKNIILILGGEDKGMSFEVFFQELSHYVKKIIMLPGNMKDAFIKQFEKENIDVEIIDAIDMKDAVVKSKSLSEPGDIVLLSPSSSSLNKYNNFEERGEDFIKCVKSLNN